MHAGIIRRGVLTVIVSRAGWSPRPTLAKGLRGCEDRKACAPAMQTDTVLHMFCFFRFVLYRTNYQCSQVWVLTRCTECPSITIVYWSFVCSNSKIFVSVLESVHHVLRQLRTWTENHACMVRGRTILQEMTKQCSGLQSIKSLKPYAVLI